MFPFAKPPIGLILHTCICIHISITPKKTGLNCGSMTCPTGGAPNINYGKNNYGKNRSICPSPLISQEKSIMEIMATSKNYGKKKVRITSGIFWTLMGKNPIMEKSDAGAACLSWTFFFSIILSVTIYIYIYIYTCSDCQCMGVRPHTTEYWALNIGVLNAKNDQTLYALLPRTLIIEHFHFPVQSSSLITWQSWLRIHTYSFTIIQTHNTHMIHT